MNTSAKDIVFDSSGNCNFCSDYLRSATIPAISDHRQLSLEALVKKVKDGGSGKPYDCIVGVSGGVDSSWVLVKAVELGLRPLAVHMDNGWNSNLAVSNISNLIDGLGVDLYTYVINWEEYRGLMEAFFDADVVDVELLYDNALHEVCFSQARKYGIKYILSGENFSTEGLKTPRGWASESKWDGRNIRRIASRFGATIKTFPIFTTAKWVVYKFFLGINWVPFLDFMNFQKESALLALEERFGYVRYPYKHYESVFTRFYQGFILPRKFGIDKRRVHLSTLVVSGQMSRTQAIEDLKGAPLVSDRDLAVDLKFFLKKMNWDQAKLDAYLDRSGVEHNFYGRDITRVVLLPFARALQAITRIKRLVGRQ